MTQNANITFTGEAADVLRKLVNIDKGLGDVNKHLIDMAKNSASAQSAGDKMLDAFSGQVGRITRDVGAIFTGLVSVQQLARLITAEYEKFKAQLSTSAEVGERFNVDMGLAKRNKPSNISDARIQQIPYNVASRAGIPPLMASGALPGLFPSAGSRLTAEQYEDVLIATAKIAPENPSEFNAIGAGAATTMAQLGIKDARQAIGFALASSKGSSVDLQSAYSERMGQVVASSVATKFDPSSSLAMFNAMSRGTRDTTGDLSRTATVNMLAALNQVRTERGLKTNDPMEVIKYLQDNKDQAYVDEVIEGIHGRAPNLEFMRSMVRKGEIGDIFYRTALAERPTLEQSLAEFDEQAASIANSPYFASAKAAQAIATASQVEALRPERVAAGQYAKALSDFRANAGTYAATDWLDEKQFELAIATGKDPRKTMIGSLRVQSQSLRAPKYAMGGEFGDLTARPEIPPSAESVRLADTIDRLIIQLEKINVNFSTTSPAPNGEIPWLAPLRDAPIIRNFAGTPEAYGGTISPRGE